MTMKIDVSFDSPGQIATECLVVPVLDHGDKDKPAPQLAFNVDPKHVTETFGDFLTTGEFTAKSFDTALFYAPNGHKAKRILLIGAGKPKKFDLHEVRKLAGAAVRYAKPKGIKDLALVLPTGVEAIDAVRAIVEGALVADFDVDTYKSDRKEQKVESLTIVMPKSDRAALDRALQEGRIIAEGQNFARSLVNEPSNRLTPTMMADRAKAMCDEVGLNCVVMGPDEIKELKMGAFWSVAQGSDEPPRLIVMRYEPAKAPAEGAPVLGLVGKGITFDTGGISIKPSEGMEKMKYDMAGGAAMIGAMRAIAQLKPPIRVIGIVCATENMPSGKAQKPGDVQIAMNGKSIEVINTDAEGRLVLADGLHYAKQLGATHLVDAATLTGACVVALGHVNGAVFTNSDEMAAAFGRAHTAAGEKMWRLPMDGEYTELLKSQIADMMNVGGRWGGAITAAKFLEEFVDETPWIHLDIAGVAWIEDNKPWIAKGPSGTPVRSLVEFARILGSDGLSHGSVGFTGGTQSKQQKGTHAAQEHADSGAGL